MNPPLHRIQRTTVIWLLLLAITAASWWLGSSKPFRDDRYVGVAIVTLAFIKIRLVILEFMEIRNAPRAMRLVFEAWLVLLCATIVLLELL